MIKTMIVEDDPMVRQINSKFFYFIFVNIDKLQIILYNKNHAKIIISAWFINT